MSLYITLEGPEATGKSTQAELLYKKLALNFPNKEIILTKEPGSKSDPVCQQIRQIILNPENDVHDRTALMLFIADRIQHMENVVLPALNRGAVVISDRSSLSTIVYHAAQMIVKNSSDTNDHLYEIIDYAQTIAPDVCFISNAKLSWSRSKLGGRASLDRIEQFGELFHKLVHDMFKEIAVEQLPISNHIIFGIRQRMTKFPKKIILLPEASKNSVEQINECIYKNVMKSLEEKK